MITLYSMQTSGNSYKVRLLLHHLGIPFRIEDVDTTRGDTRRPEFLAMNPTGKAPVIVFGDGRSLSESGAILLHFSEGTDFLPTDSFDRAKVYQWMFFEQYSHEPAIAVRRSLRHYPAFADQASPARMTDLLERGHVALAVMEARLKDKDWLAGSAMSAADIALYAYTHDAGPNGGFDLDRFPGVSAWIERVAAQPGHVPIEWRPEGHEAAPEGA